MNEQPKDVVMKAQPTSITEKMKRSALVKAFMKRETVNTEIKLTMGVIESLKLLHPLPRNTRRKIARTAGMDWDFYRLLEKEVIKRKKAGVALDTGLPIEEKPKDSI
jgi:hypothetical protein